MTINVTIKIDSNPPGTCARIERVMRTADDTAVTVLARLGAGQSHRTYICFDTDIRVVEEQSDV